MLLAGLLCCTFAQAHTAAAARGKKAPLLLLQCTQTCATDRPSERALLHTQGKIARSLASSGRSAIGGPFEHATIGAAERHQQQRRVSLTQARVAAHKHRHRQQLALPAVAVPAARTHCSQLNRRWLQSPGCPVQPNFRPTTTIAARLHWSVRAHVFAQKVGHSASIVVSSGEQG